ncbi:uncharacterized protein B0J16DRAFT_397786 [Fusarium flagelliforme]|uniref:uncharacterized protein n=1 Tax=Fusarium flagelliforme TaxID=2675880 RepID=UPI001E8CF413|nr:uncharacterized protein B0J16DRAFT_397786 [Fusarium flagelliforme]KAH7184520.1 hypothetical protein B0J16DRAFT_397786 [Fusarium flagelliforme]
MSLLLAPYNDSMRLGMGFNSYTQTTCMDNAVEVKEDNVKHDKNPAQVVKYSAKFVEKLSDIVSNMNISKSSAIKQGTIEVHGNANTIDEDKIKASDVNLVVSVQVTNQTTTVKNDAEFKMVDGIDLGTQGFKDAYGDCYISGFIEGGDFSSIISIRCLDQSKTNSVTQSIKSMTKTKDEDEDFTMDSYSLEGISSSASDALKETEMTMSVSWMGGSQIKDEKKSWNIDSVYEAAAAFPSNVAKTPQKTWAILTKYKANRSFNALSAKKVMFVLDYEAVHSYTADLFDNFMEYKQLMKVVQDIMSNSDQYQEVKTNGTDKPIPLDSKTLVAVRHAMRNEMNKIVAIMSSIDTLAKEPHLVIQDSFETESSNQLVQAIVDGFKPKASTKKTDNSSLPLAKAQEQAPSPESPSGKSSEGGFDKVEAPRDETSQPAGKPATPDDGPGRVKDALSSLIPPEIWADLLPVRKVTSKDASASSSAPIRPLPTVDIIQANIPAVNDVPKQIKFGHGVISNRLSCTFECNGLLVSPSDEQPFLSFDNDISFWFHHDGNFAVYTKKGQEEEQQVQWETKTSKPKQAYILRFHEDGNLCTWCYKDSIDCPSWSTNCPGDNYGKLLLSNASPFIEVFDSENRKIWDTAQRWHNKVGSSSREWKSEWDHPAGNTGS